MLADLVETPLSSQEIGDLFTMTGFELEEIFESEGEDVFDIAIMANRGDAASVFGLARELVAKDREAKPTDLFRRLENRVPMTEAGSEVSDLASIAIETPDCARYAARVFLDVQNGPSPEWLQRRLRQIGQRPISLLVDLTNYVMMEMGQPLHAFDLDKLHSQAIIVRLARSGEKLTTLDGREHDLQPHHMLICDADRPVALAGIMGGEETEVSATTTRCLLESASFLNTSVRRTRKELGLHTEASYRFERHVDPSGVVAALNRFAELYEACTGQRPAAGVLDLYPGRAEPAAVSVRAARASLLLGMPVSTEDAERSLSALGFRITDRDDTAVTVEVPSWRADVSREEDLIEEIGRVMGYEGIPAEAPIGSTPIGGSHGIHAFTDDVRGHLLASGFDQMLSHTLRDLHPLDEPGERVRVRTPHSPELAYLRNHLWTSLAENALRNGARDLSLFEIGKVFAPGRERRQVALLATGAQGFADWRNGQPATSDFFSVKGVLESLARHVGRHLDFAPGQDARLHPTRQAVLEVEGQALGLLGVIHPDVAEAADLPENTVLACLDLDEWFETPAPVSAWRPVSRHPSTRRDIAILVPKTLSYRAIELAVVKAAGIVLERTWLFDVYDGKGIPDGHQSLAIAMTYRKPDATFTDEEANQVRDSVVAALTALGAQLRG